MTMPNPHEKMPMFPWGIRHGFAAGLHNRSRPVLAEDTSLQAALEHATPVSGGWGESEWRTWEGVTKNNVDVDNVYIYIYTYIIIYIL